MFVSPVCDLTFDCLDIETLFVHACTASEHLGYVRTSRSSGQGHRCNKGYTSVTNYTHSRVVHCRVSTEGKSCAKCLWPPVISFMTVVLKLAISVATRLHVQC